MGTEPYAQRLQSVATEELLKKRRTLRAIVTVVAAIVVAFVITSAVLIYTRGFRMELVLSTVTLMMTVSATLVVAGKMKVIDTELERRQRQAAD